jgi:hypothetical protein
MASQPSSGKGKRIALYVGGGCLSIIMLCCCSGVGAYIYRQSTIGSAAQDHAETFLRQVQAGDWEAAHASSRYRFSVFGAGPSERDAYRACIQDTALADMTSFDCDGVHVEPMQDDGEVRCTVQSTARGQVDITVHVNSADRGPYLGFIWFASRGAFGSHWASGSCSLYSGREYYRDPPSGRVRP